jgi:hypothetical protein
MEPKQPRPAAERAPRRLRLVRDAAAEASTAAAAPPPMRPLAADDLRRVIGPGRQVRLSLED